MISNQYFHLNKSLLSSNVSVIQAHILTAGMSNSAREEGIYQVILECSFINTETEKLLNVEGFFPPPSFLSHKPFIQVKGGAFIAPF